MFEWFEVFFVSSIFNRMVIILIYLLQKNKSGSKNCCEKPALIKTRLSKKKFHTNFSHSLRENMNKNYSRASLYYWLLISRFDLNENLAIIKDRFIQQKVGKKLLHFQSFDWKGHYCTWMVRKVRSLNIPLCAGKGKLLQEKAHDGSYPTSYSFPLSKI